MTLKLAFVGFRHGHINTLYALAQQADDIEITGACEEHEPTRRQLAEGAAVAITHDDYGRMLSDVECDAVAVGDAYGLRGVRLIQALSQGKHVIADKPLCTRLSELGQVEALSADGGLKVGCMLTMRDSGKMRRVRQLLREDAIGEVHAITFGGQHPLLLGSRPEWYFEPGMHGGTINDIGIHAIDAIPWLTGLSFSRVQAARCWNAFAPESPHFGDGAQMMLSLENGAGVLGDVSYFMPDRAGYRLPQYWRTTLWGRRGLIETATGQDQVCLTREGDEEPQWVAADQSEAGGYLRTFRADIERARLDPDDLDTAAVLASARRALQVQQAADEGLTDLPL
jgi:predicted dehydrogenase